MSLPGGQELPDWDHPGSWLCGEAVDTLEQLCRDGLGEVPVYDIAGDGRLVHAVLGASSAPGAGNRPPTLDVERSPQAAPPHASPAPAAGSIPRMDERPLRELLRHQDGVVSRRQVLACGGDDDLIERRIRRREWARVHPGVYVDHTGPLSWDQRAWAAVLLCWPAALSHDSALQAHCPDARTPSVDAPIHVAVDVGRRHVAREGIRLHRVTGLADRVQSNRTPPRVTFDEAVLQVASDASDEATAVAVIADACQSRRTTPQRLAGLLRTRTHLPRRRFLMELLEDVATGAYSVLEHRYLTRVERPHALPTARRQRRVRQGRTPAYRDVEYRGLGVVVELDGRLGHEHQVDRWDDLDRDIDSVVAGDVTARVGWRQVLSPCRLAGAVARLLAARGWSGQVRACGPGCSASPVHAVRGASPATVADDRPRTAARAREPGAGD